ncbi:MAG: trigger factor [Chloroflexi bacterium]|nr:trigger factor [Chloroflexota bacterium]
MKSSLSPAGRSTVVLEVELPPERIKRQIDDSVRHMGRRTRVPGFRPGKVPRSMLERALGVRRDDPAAPNPLYDDAKDHLFETTVLEALKDSDLDVLEIPRPEWTSFDEAAGASYRVTLPIRPEVRLGAYTDYPFGVDLDTIDDTKVDAVLEQLRDQHATLAPVEDRAAQNGDYAVVRFEGRRDGEPFEGGTAERFPLVLGSERMIPGFEAGVVGMREGETKTFAVTFPEDYGEAELAGKDAEFEVELRELRTKVMPVADDDFARAVGRYDDLAALRREIAARLERNALDRGRHVFSDRIIDFAVSNATVELSDLLVDREVEVMHDELKVRLAGQRIGYEEYLRAIEKDEATVLREYREPAEQRVKTLLVLTAIAEQEGIEVGDPEIDAEVARSAASGDDSPKLLEYLRSPRGRAYVRSTLRRSKTVETLVDRWLDAHPEAPQVRHLHRHEDGGPVGEDGSHQAHVHDHDHEHRGDDSHDQGGEEAAEAPTLEGSRP